MQDSSVRYFANGHTAKGFHSLFASALQGLERVIVLQGGPGCGKSTLIRQIGEALESRGAGVEWIHCAFDSSTVDGVIDRELKFAVIDGSGPHCLDPAEYGLFAETIDMSGIRDNARLSGQEAEIADLTDLVEACRKEAYANFAEALSIHDEWEKIYIANLNTEAVNRVAEKMIKVIFEDNGEDSWSQSFGASQEGVMFHRFLGAATPDGAVDFVKNLTASVGKRYFIKGRPGTGKSTMLKRIAAAGVNKGFAAEVYHCGFDPDSLDMVIIRELEVAVFDSTAPHEYFPERDNDEIIDMYELAVAEGTDEAFMERLADVKRRYAAKMRLGLESLAQARAFYRKLKDIYVQAADFTRVEQIRRELLSAVLPAVF